MIAPKPFLIDGVPAKEIVRHACLAGWIKFPSPAWQSHVLDGAPRPPSKFDELPDDEQSQLEVARLRMNANDEALRELAKWPEPHNKAPM
jgi:hypothetical protein